MSGMVANVGVAVGIWSRAQSFVHLLFPFPVSMDDILIFGSRSTAGNVASSVSESGMAENMGIEVEIASVTGKRLFPLPV